ncbi:MAG: hypothetical protein M3O15_09840, partial [Acidobacteriota bacterium]|nr:hypothetical protein [Acidobacteriota bacterium]
SRNARTSRNARNIRTSRNARNDRNNRNARNDRNVERGNRAPTRAGGESPHGLAMKSVDAKWPPATG